VTSQNGHGSTTEIYSAPKKALLKDNLETPDIKVVDVKYLGQQVVSVIPDDETGGVQFTTQIDGNDVSISREQLGYNHLNQLFYNQVEKLKKEMDEYY
jgi:hypothetical protein